MSARVEVAPYYPRYVADTLADAARLTLEEYGALQLLEAVAWREGGIDADARGELARLLRVPAKRAAALWAVVGRGWTRDAGGRYVLPAMEAHRAAAAVRRTTAQENGRKGGRPPVRSGGDPGSPTETQRVSEQEPSTNPNESFAVAVAGKSKQASELDARGGGDPDRNGHRPPPPADPPPLAVALTVAANQGAAAVVGEQPVPFVATSRGAAALAAECEAAGVPPAFAARAVADAARQYAEQHAGDGEPPRPRTLRYFAPGLLEAWQRSEANRVAAEQPAPAPLEPPGLAVVRTNGHGHPAANGHRPRFGRDAAGRDTYGTVLRAIYEDDPV